MTTKDPQIVMIDDEKDFRDQIQQEAEKLNRELTTFRNFLPLLRYMHNRKGEKFVVVVDWNLHPQSHMQGIDLIKHVRRSLRDRTVIYVLTGDDSVQTEAQAIAAGAKRFFVKGPTALEEIMKYSTKEVVDTLLAAEEEDERVERDELTGLYNLRGFRSRANDALRAAHRKFRDFEESGTPSNRRKDHNSSVLVVMDLDKFKSVNDNHGHFKGDEMLVTFARTVEGMVRDADVFGRLYGDEFLLLIHGVNLQKAGETLCHLQTDLQKVSVPLGNGEVFTLSMTWGCVEIPHADIGDLEEHMKAADLALTKAKAERPGGLTLRD